MTSFYLSRWLQLLFSKPDVSVEDVVIFAANSNDFFYVCNKGSNRLRLVFLYVYLIFFFL